MKLYHGTSAEAARLILKGGFQPRSHIPFAKSEGNWQHTVVSSPHAVYLTTAYAPYFAAVAAGDSGALAVIELESTALDPDQLRPDEDFLEQATRANPFIMSPEGERLPTGLEGRVAWFRDNVHMFSESWRESLEHMGTCCHYGAIPATAITRVVLCDGARAATMVYNALDPQISIWNYKLMGATYRALTQWFMLRPVRPADLLGDGLWDAMGPRHRAEYERVVADQAMLDLIYEG